ncbi:hypothetical protein V5739_01450 [Salinimicrobium sp. TIG7-5_MAKvit]|uniref:hypothetical protein n=1 Tax=Salinimicrobium sp. TIG7-5_MAKvit TaxID=3121289 RepID=UPI003C6E1F78
MNKLVYFVLIFTLIQCKTSEVDQFDSTGTYVLGKYNPDSAEEIREYFGEIQVKQIDADKIAMTFMINKGAPGYNSGSFIDTLIVKNKVANYRTQFDESCKITFAFDRGGVRVNEETEDFNSGCGFGHAVVAKGYFRKISSDTPVLRNPMTGEEL